MTHFSNLQLIEIAGEALYGAGRWQQQIAPVIGVTDRTVRRWLAGTGAPSKEHVAKATQAVLHRSRAMKSTHIFLANKRDLIPD